MVRNMNSIQGLSGFVLTLLLVGIIIIVALLILGSFGKTVNQTQTYNQSSITSLNNAQGTSNSTGLNTYINGYVNTNVSGYKNDTTANFTGTAPSTVWIKLYVNGVATTASYHEGNIINSSYVLTSGDYLYKVTVASNSTSYTNVTYYLDLNKNYYTYTQVLTSGGVLANTSLGQVISAFSTIASYLPLIALVVVAGIIISVVVLSFAFGGRREEGRD